MKFFSTLLLALLLLGTLPAHAATLSLEAPLAAADSAFYLPVVLTLEETESINTVAGSIQVPEGVTIESIDTSGSAFSLFAEGPRYILASRTIAFTAGAPGGLPQKSTALLFVIKAHAALPGAYVFTPSGVSAYANDGQGTNAVVAFTPARVSVGVAGSVHTDALPAVPSAPIIAAIGRDESLFEGKWFATFYGGASGSSVDHYDVREGWWHPLVRAERYYVLEDQRRTSTVWITAVGENGHRVTTSIPAADPWPERLLLAGIVLLLGLIGALAWRVFRKRS